MVFCSTMNEETILMHPEDDLNETHYINLIMSNHEPKFFVTCCCDEDWIWELYYTSKTDYDRVKWCIMDLLSECENMYQLMDLLDEVFVEVFADMIVEEEYECCGECRSILN